MVVTYHGKYITYETDFENYVIAHTNIELIMMRPEISLKVYYEHPNIEFIKYKFVHEPEYFIEIFGKEKVVNIDDDKVYIRSHNIRKDQMFLTHKGRKWVSTRISPYATVTNNEYFHPLIEKRKASSNTETQSAIIINTKWNAALLADGENTLFLYAPDTTDETLLEAIMKIRKLMKNYPDATISYTATYFTREKPLASGVINKNGAIHIAITRDGQIHVYTRGGEMNENSSD